MLNLIKSNDRPMIQILVRGSGVTAFAIRHRINQVPTVPKKKLKCQSGVAVPRLDLKAVEDGLRGSTLPFVRPLVLFDRDRRFVPGHLTTEYLGRNYGGMMVPLDANSGDACTVKMSEFLSFENASLRSRYLRNLHIAEWFPKELKHMRLPTVFGENILNKPEIRCPKAWKNWFELFVCSSHCEGFPVLHIDTCNVHAISMQIQGRKRFTIFAPSDTPFLYPSTQTSSMLPTDLEGIDLEKFPLFARATAFVVDIGPGDILLVPAGWWHTAKCIGSEPAVSVAASFVDPANENLFLDSYSDFCAAQSLIKHGALKIFIDRKKISYKTRTRCEEVISNQISCSLIKCNN